MYRCTAGTYISCIIRASLLLITVLFHCSNCDRFTGNTARQTFSLNTVALYTRRWHGSLFDRITVVKTCLYLFSVRVSYATKTLSHFSCYTIPYVYQFNRVVNCYSIVSTRLTHLTVGRTQAEYSSCTCHIYTMHTLHYGYFVRKNVKPVPKRCILSRNNNKVSRNNNYCTVSSVIQWYIEYFDR